MQSHWQKGLVNHGHHVVLEPGTTRWCWRYGGSAIHICIQSADYFGLLTCTSESCGWCPARWDHVYECTSAVWVALLALCAGSRAMSNCLNHSVKKGIIPIVFPNISFCRGETMFEKIRILKTLDAIKKQWPFHVQICLLTPKSYQGTLIHRVHSFNHWWCLDEGSHLYAERGIRWSGTAVPFSYIIFQAC
jgi:hypothetical protein